jgi:hypothetical protein
MRQRYIGGALIAALAVLTAPGIGKAQWSPTIDSSLGGGEGGGFSTPLNADPPIPIPTGKAGDAGFYVASDFVMLNMTRAIGNQVIAKRGFYDSEGFVTGTTGTFIGSGNVAISTKNLSGADYQPGWNVEVGYRTEGGLRFFMNFMQLVETNYTRGAGPVPQSLNVGDNLADSFISSPVYNFGTAFAGPQFKLAVDGQGNNPGYTAYGIWNGATQEQITFTQKYTQSQIGSRIPMFETDYSRMYAIAGGQYSWFYERFQWQTLDVDINGNTQPQWAAYYKNILTQRMYGAMFGVGHEIFVANQFSVSFEATGSGLLDIAKQKAKYSLDDQSSESKWQLDQYRFVPNANASVNLWWYPIEGVQVRLGYEIMTFYNTLYMKDPVGFDAAAIDPQYGVKAFRLIHGVNAGIGFFF